MEENTPTEAAADMVTAKAAEVEKEAEEEDATEDVPVEAMAEEEKDHTTLKSDLTCLPWGIDLQNFTFSDEKWHGFSQEQKTEIWALRNINNNRGNQKEKGGDISSLGHSAAGFTNNERQVFQMVQVPALPPPPRGVQPPAPHDGRGNATTGGDGTRSSNDGNAFGCN